MTLAEMSFAGTVMIFVIAVIRAIAVNKLPKKTFLLLWEIVMLRLIIPVSIPSPSSIYIPFLRLRVSAPHRSTSLIRPPTAPKKGDFSSVSAEETKCIERNSVGIRVRAVIKSPNDPEIHIRVSLTFRTVGIQHRFKEIISRFRSFVPLTNFSIANCCDAVL